MQSHTTDQLSRSLHSPRQNVPVNIAETLRAKIFHGELKPGERLPPERVLAAQLGTNRNTLREALRSLEAQGLLRARQGDGVRILDYRQCGELGLLPHYFALAAETEQLEILGQLMRLRTVLATEVVVWAAERGSGQIAVELQPLVDGMRQAFENGDVNRLAYVELNIYRTLVTASGSIALMWVFNTLEKVLQGFLHRYPHMWVVPESLPTAWNGVLDALRQRNADCARDILKQLFQQTDALVLDALGLARSSDTARAPEV